MRKTRRSVLFTLMGMASGLSIYSSMAWAAQAPAPMPSPNAPRNQNVPGGLDGLPNHGADKAPTNPLLQQQIAGMVQQLYKLSSELKEEVEHTNMNATFSVSFVKKAQQIERLAKQIKDRSKG